MITEIIVPSEVLSNNNVVNKDGVMYSGLAIVIDIDDTAPSEGRVYQYCTDWYLWELLLNDTTYNLTSEESGVILVDSKAKRAIGFKTSNRAIGNQVSAIHWNLSNEMHERSITMVRTHMLSQLMGSVRDTLHRLAGENYLPYLIRVRQFQPGRLCLAIDEDNVPMLVRNDSLNMELKLRKRKQKHVSKSNNSK
jgi:hypothetical protein